MLYGKGVLPVGILQLHQLFFQTLILISSFVTSFLVVADRNIVKMLPTAWANFLDQNKWFSKSFNEDKTERTKTLSISDGGGKSPPHTENKVSRRQHSLANSLELYTRFPLEMLWS